MQSMMCHGEDDRFKVNGVGGAEEEGGYNEMQSYAYRMYNVF
jgi:hypothetical protein